MDPQAAGGQQRNHLIRALRKKDPETWTYPNLARTIGPTEELIAKIVQCRV